MSPRKKYTPRSGYVDCACRDCFEVAIEGPEDTAPALCWECGAAGCLEGEECSVVHLPEDQDELAGEVRP